MSSFLLPTQDVHTAQGITNLSNTTLVLNRHYHLSSSSSNNTANMRQNMKEMERVSLALQNAGYVSLEAVLERIEALEKAATTEDGAAQLEELLLVLEKALSHECIEVGRITDPQQLKDALNYLFEHDPSIREFRNLGLEALIFSYPDTDDRIGLHLSRRGFNCMYKDGERIGYYNGMPLAALQKIPIELSHVILRVEEELAMHKRRIARRSAHS